MEALPSYPASLIAGVGELSRVAAQDKTNAIDVMMRKCVIGVIAEVKPSAERCDDICLQRLMSKLTGKPFCVRSGDLTNISVFLLKPLLDYEGVLFVYYDDTGEILDFECLYGDDVANSWWRFLQ